MDKIKKIFNDYCAKYPILNKDAILDLMIKECKDLKITPEISKALKNGESLFILNNGTIEKALEKEKINMTEIFGGSFINKKHVEVEKNVPEIKKHKVTDLVEVDSNGEIFSNQFTIEGLRKKFDEQEYKITQEKDEYGTYFNIIDRKTGKKYLEYEIGREYELIGGSSTITKYNKSGEKEEIVLLHNKKTDFEIGTVSKYDYDKKSGQKIFYRDGKIEKIYDWSVVDKKGTWDITKITLYSNGKPYKEMLDYNNTIVNYIVDDLKKHFQPDKKGKILPLMQLEEMIGNITKKNVWEILYDYKSQTGHDLMDDIKETVKEETKFSSNAPFYLEIPYYRMIKKIKECQKYDGSLTDSWLNDHIQSYVTDRLIEDLSKGNIETFKEDLKMVGLNLNAEEKEKIEIAEAFLGNVLIYKVLSFFQEKAKKLYQDDKSNPDKIKGILYTIAKCEKIEPKEKANLLMDIITKLGFITDEPKIKQEIKDFISNKEFMEFIMQHCTIGKYSEDIKSDMILNINNPEKILVDFKRLGARNEIKEKNKNVTKPNGTLDVDFKQGNTGDCWLIAGIISCIKKTNMKSKIESLLKVDTNTGNVKVTFKGAKKSYVIPFEEIKNANHLSSGDGDLRALELAFDKYIRELAYDKKVDAHNVDINGNTTYYLYQVLFGNGEDAGKYSSEMNKDFNNPNKAFCIGASNISTEYKYTIDVLINSKGEKEDFVTGHAYAVLKSDGKYVYLINPWNSKEVYKITHENLEKISPNVGVCDLA